MPKLPPDLDLHIEARVVGKSRIDPDDFLFIQHQRLRGEIISGAGKRNFEVHDCTFDRCRFEDMKFKDWSSCLAAGTEQSFYRDCVFDRCRFVELGMGQARFERCDFRDVHIKGLFSQGADYVDCTFSGTMKGAVILGKVFGIDVDHTPRELNEVRSNDHAVIKLNEIRGNDFTALKMIDCDFRRGVDLRLQKLPTGDQYFLLVDAERKLGALRRKYLQQPASKVRASVIFWVDFHEEMIRDGQLDHFLCAGYFDPAVGRQVWQELESL